MKREIRLKVAYDSTVMHSSDLAREINDLYSPLTTHYSLLTTHHSLLTTYCFALLSLLSQFFLQQDFRPE
jgi:hypothetical protein